VATGLGIERLGEAISRPSGQVIVPASFAVLASVAVLTERIRLGTTVTPITRRRPWVVSQVRGGGIALGDDVVLVARQAATVDQLSGGRMILGVGLGDTGESVGSDASFTHFGEERDAPTCRDARRGTCDRRRPLERRVLFLHGKHFDVAEVTFLPPPVQRPRIPIWVGGGYPNRGPTERALRWDGSCLYDRDGRPLASEDVRDLRTRAGSRRFAIMAGGWGRLKDPDAEREQIRAVAEAGATWWGEYVAPGDRKGMQAAVERGPLRVDR
jgi:alkanesulfonate monooxygenase SsuD/methylene tetrahydromethanopterin reductase-like flavin-dependent oxidoreductase (luciferase family)